MKDFLDVMSPLIEFVSANFWQLLVIFVLIKYRRTWGILLLVCQVVWGYHGWVYALFGIIGALDSDTQFITAKLKGHTVTKKKSTVETDPDYK